MSVRIDLKKDTETFSKWLESAEGVALQKAAKLVLLEAKKNLNSASIPQLTELSDSLRIATEQNKVNVGSNHQEALFYEFGTGEPVMSDKERTTVKKMAGLKYLRHAFRDTKSELLMIFEKELGADL